MFDALEARRLMAAAPSAVLKHGTLTITGTNRDDQITILYGIRYPTAVAGEPYLATVKGAYVVSLDKNAPFQTFETSDVKSIKVYGLGGRDTINGPKSFDNLLRNVPEANAPALQAVRAEKLAPLYVDGGSGSDRLTGGTGDDVLIGGRGNDILVDQYGRNTLLGGLGRDSYNTTEGSVRVVRDFAAGQTPYIRQLPGGTRAAPDQLIDVKESGVTNLVTSDSGVDALAGFGGVVHISPDDASAIGSDTDTLVIASIAADVIGRL